MSRLRAFQVDVRDRCYKAWADGAKVVMPVVPTGGGKTVIMGDIARNYDGHGCAMAHRSELVGQVSVAMAREGIRHDLIAPKTTIKTIVQAHIDACGRSYFDHRANWKVASVDTIIRRQLDDRWLRNVGLFFQDEGHHTLRDNKWGRAAAMFPNAWGLLPTATPGRADGKGLGSHAEGIVDALIEGPTMRWLIDQGFLTSCEIHAPKVEDLDLDDLEVGSTGDFVAEKMRKRVKGSRKIIGDVVATYLEHARGLLGITFAVDVEHANALCAAFIAAGVPAAVVTADTPEDQRRKILRDFEERRIFQLVNVDLFGEGFDLPAIQCVSMARPTASYGLYAQQFGRALRLMISPLLHAAWDTYTPMQRKAFIAGSDKPIAKLFDHVGNVMRHKGPPWFPRLWTLDSREKRGSGPSDAIPLKICSSCEMKYESHLTECPYCGAAPPLPADRSTPKHVDGDIVLYTEEMLAALFDNIAKVDAIDPGVQGHSVVAMSIRKRHYERQRAQHHLRDTIAYWAGMYDNESDRVKHKRFFLTFGIDVLTAKTLGKTEAEELAQRVRAKIDKTVINA